MNRVFLTALLMTLTPVLPASVADTLRFSTVHIRDHDEMIGGEAFTVLVPSNWKVSGGLLWRLHPLYPATTHLRLFDPNSPDQLESFPNHVAASACSNAVQFLKETLLPRVRAESKPVIVAERNLPAVADAVEKADAPAGPDSLPTTYNAGQVRVEYDWNGKRVEEDFIAVLVTTTLPGPDKLKLQLVDRIVALRAGKGMMASRMPVFETILASSRITLRWFNRYAQLTQALSQTSSEKLREPGELQRLVRQTNDNIADAVRQAHEQAGEAELSFARSLTPKGCLQLRDDPRSKASSVVALPAGYRVVWANDRGEIVLSDNPKFQPGPEDSAGGAGAIWRELKVSGAK